MMLKKLSLGSALEMKTAGREVLGDPVSPDERAPSVAGSPVSPLEAKSRFDSAVKIAGFMSRLQISETGFAFDPQTGSTFSLNGAGVKIIRSLIGGKEPKEIAAELVSEYGLDSSRALRDVEDFVATLKGLELL